MPTAVRIYIRLNGPPEDFSLEDLRSKFLQAFSLDEGGDFYSSGPLKIVGEEDRPYMPVKDEQSIWINVNLWKSYYGVGYERGDPRLFIQCAEWLEERLPGCEIYYGHDVNDENVSLFDKPARERLMAYYHKVGHRPYYTESWEEKKEMRKLWNESKEQKEREG